VEKADGGFSLFRQDGATQIWRRGRNGSSPVCPADFHVPDFFRGAVMYQIFPDRSRDPADAAAGQARAVPHARDLSDTPDYAPDENGEIRTTTSSAET
jgi:hypothetical protein